MKGRGSLHSQLELPEDEFSEILVLPIHQQETADSSRGVAEHRCV